MSGSGVVSEAGIQYHVGVGYFLRHKPELAIAGSEKAHLLGYCLGGTLTTIYGALYPDTVASMVNLAAPIDFRDDGLLSISARGENSATMTVPFRRGASTIRAPRRASTSSAAFAVPASSRSA